MVHYFSIICQASKYFFPTFHSSFLICYAIIAVTMKLHRKVLAVFASLALAAGVVFLVFLARPAALIVTDLSFAPLYGADRIREETLRSSAVLFRRVKTVPIADDAGDDIIQIAIAEASSKPFCVIFPLRFAQAARVYREQNPAVPVVLLEGRSAENANPASFAIGSNRDDYFIYKTDINADFYLAGLAAAVLDREKNGKIAVFLESSIQTQGKEAFLRALKDIEKPLQTSFYTAFSQFSGNSDLSCVVLAGIGAEYLEKYTDVPVIFFTWLDPTLIPADITVVLNDSPWAQAEQAVRMVAANLASGQIRSTPLLLPGKGVDKAVLQELRKLL